MISVDFHVKRNKLRRHRKSKTKGFSMDNMRSSLLNEDETVPSRDWRKALRAQPAFRIVNKTMRGQTQFITIIGLTGLCVLIILYMYPKRGGISLKSSFTDNLRQYNRTYPLSRPIKTSSLYTFKIGIITDLDQKSKNIEDKSMWNAYFKTGFLSYNPISHNVMITWDRSDPKILKNSYSLKDRGMELSELVVFDGRLLTFDDRTGIVFEILNEEKMVPWVLLVDGDGRSEKGFKSEWATVKNEILYVGSMGKEWTTDAGEFQSHDPQYVKTVTVKGEVSHLNWVKEFNRLRESIGIHWPGYMIHESGVWSEVHRKWFFLPRRCSKEQYNDSLDEKRGCNVLLSADNNMYDVSVVELKNINTRGFSSFKFVPTTEDQIIVALKTEEVEGKTASYITAFTIKGEILLQDMFVSDLKYEGVEFI
ncbi:apyrase [Euwallacea fornicatus]|uniref:apyrase n=1 Tax=Euwallacea fornicatus TaxID=995702 RepID=UPI00338E6586